MSEKKCYVFAVWTTWRFCNSDWAVNPLHKGGYCFCKCNWETLNGQEVADIDMSAGNEPDSEAGKYHHPPRHVIFALRYNWKPRRSGLQTTQQDHIIRERVLVEPPQQPIDIVTVSLIFYLPATYCRRPLLFHLRAIQEVLLESSQTDLIGLWLSLFFPLQTQTQTFELMNCFLSVTDIGWHVSPPGGCFVFFFPLSYYLQICLYVFIVNLHMSSNSSLQVSEVKTSYCLWLHLW